GAYEAAMFHLFTHAFFKALLFLGAGSVIHAMHHEQDMRKMGGLKEKIPLTYWMMVIGTVAITGVGVPLVYFGGTPLGFAGFLSKDMIVETAFAAHTGAGMYAFWMLIIGAVMTSFYSWRLIFLTFHGQTRADHHTFDHAHESPNVMLIPLVVLAIGSFAAGMVFYPEFVGKIEEEWWAGSIASIQTVMHDGHGISILEAAHHVPYWVKVSPFVAMLLGLGIAVSSYMRSPVWMRVGFGVLAGLFLIFASVPWYIAVPIGVAMAMLFLAIPYGSHKDLAERHQVLHQFLLNKWYFDEIYDFLFVRPVMWVGRFFWKRGDGNTIDGFLNGLAMGLVPWMTRRAGRLQSGFLFHYAFVMLIGVSLIITWFAIGGGH
ncbi:MAG: proton-conducting transporter membrane subunit, partial [Pseudomonadota bacterium]